jgi:hypothetical protein
MHDVLQNTCLRDARDHHYKSADQTIKCKAQTHQYNELYNVQVKIQEGSHKFLASRGDYLKFIRADHETLKQQHGGTIADEAVPLHLS